MTVASRLSKSSLKNEYSVREACLSDHLHLPVDGSAELREHGLPDGGRVHAVVPHPQLRILGNNSDVYNSVEHNCTELRGGGGCPLVEFLW